MAKSFQSNSTNETRSLQIYLILIGAAARRETITYISLAGKMYGTKSQHTLAQKLEPLMQWCAANNLPALTSLVVDATKGVPNAGLTTASDFPAEQQKVFDFDWYSIFPPTIDEMKPPKKTIKTGPRTFSNGRIHQVNDVGHITDEIWISHEQYLSHGMDYTDKESQEFFSVLLTGENNLKIIDVGRIKGNKDDEKQPLSHTNRRVIADNSDRILVRVTGLVAA